MKAFPYYLFESPQFLSSFFVLGQVIKMPVKLYFDCQCQCCLIDYLTPSAARTKVLKCVEDFRCLWQCICSDTCWGKFLMSSRLCWGKLPPVAILIALKICTTSFQAECYAFKDREVSSEFCAKYIIMKGYTNQNKAKNIFDQHTVRVIRV